MSAAISASGTATLTRCSARMSSNTSPMWETSASNSSSAVSGLSASASGMVASGGGAVLGDLVDQDHDRYRPQVFGQLALFADKEEEKRRDRIITAVVRLGRAAGIYLEICGQRFGFELGKGITMLRAQLTGRTAHRVNDEISASMAFGDIAPDAALAAIQIPAETRGLAVAGDFTGG